MRSDAPALMPIFRSRHQAELLARLLNHPDDEYSLSELARTINVPLSTLQREADRLADAGLIRTRTQGRNRLISANSNNPATAPLTQLLNLSFSPLPVIAEEFSAVPGTEAVVIFGSWAARYAGIPGPPPNDIDVLIIGNTSQLNTFAAADRAQARIGTEVNPVQCTPQRWAAPGDDTLIAEIHRSPHTIAYATPEQP
ncbi:MULTISPECIES: winged helix-turn-helix domain-containing protein [Mycolicibacter]|uniref:Winged helix-turn-helix domain-containing protein n=2 Tax=Mycolicibacter TaxID=1073531 RepID=A0ABU5XL06_9MYCO|nr:MULTISPECIES: winged helix-turn-helix domain-containing protein [unclassified Mycolicibacter]MEB3022965.1 winged helix-turn-helix domain-containing protein [Mycolicibacter sp. MYC098]MEB3033475.1 winged helix-turn-helix domain-containing protein [Mycolicibacter sp. MYC340]